MIRAFVGDLVARLRETRPLIQVVLGPRQVGKTTGIHQALSRIKGPRHYASAADTLAASREWLREQWQLAKGAGKGGILVVDEVQKIPNWAEVVKQLWDARDSSSLKLVLLGSGSLGLQRGLSESLAGRFELLTVPHWSFPESRRAFGDTLATFLRFGGYPGAHPFITDYPRWFSYVKTAIVDRVIGHDILTQRNIQKPALFRQAFEILCGYPAQEISYTKLLGQLQDRGNTDLIKHYVELFEGAYFFRALTKYSPRHVVVKTSIPKILPLCPALYTLAAGPHVLDNPEAWGRAFEAAVGADLSRIPGATLSYWREGNREVDFVVRQEGRLYGIEAKSGRKKSAQGLTTFREHYPEAKTCIVSTDNYKDFSEEPQTFLKVQAI